MTLASTGALEIEAKVKYIRTLARGEALSKFDLVSADAKNIEARLYADYLLKGLARYFLL